MPCGIDFHRRFAVGVCLIFPWLAGCAAFHPMNGIPARYVPDELKVGRRNGQRTIDPSLLTQIKPPAYLIDGGDMLGIYIAGVLGKVDETPPIQIPQNPDYRPAAGFPVSVHEDGTISLPWVGALNVRGLTTRETEQLIIKAYTDKGINHEFLKEGRERVLVEVMKPRQTRVLVIRQDSRNEPMANAAVGLLNIGTAKRGSGKVVSLPAYSNDVLNALVATDGLPGLDAENAVYIIRRRKNDPGQEPFMRDNVDPEQLIRDYQSKKAIIRGQSADGWDFPAQPSRPNPFFNESFSNRPTSRPNSSTPYFPNGQTIPNQNREINVVDGDVSDEPPQGDVMPAQLSRRTFRPGPAPASPGATDTLNGQSWGAANGSSIPMLREANSQNSLWPTPINSSQQPLVPVPQNSPSNPLPAPQQQAPTNMWGQPNWPPQPGNNPPAYGSPYNMPALPGQGYSLPDAARQPSDQIDLDGAHSEPPPYDPNNRGADIGLADDRRIIRIPIRLRADEQVDIRQEDIILNDGDIVFIESRDAEVFFTGGLLGGGQYTLPRDYDLDILQALSIATSRVTSNGAVRQLGGVSALNSDVSVSPSSLVVIRKLPEGGEIPIKVDLYQARTDLSERIIIQPGDYIYLQYTPVEAVGAFIERNLIEGALLGIFTQQLNVNR